MPKSNLTRRACLAAALAVLLMAAALLGAHRGWTQGQARRAARLPDVPTGPGGANILPNGWQVTPAGKTIALPGDMPLTMLLTPDGKSLLVNTAGYNEHSVSVINVASGKLTQSVDVGSDWLGMCLRPDGSEVYIAGGGTPGAKFLRAAARKGDALPGVPNFDAPVLRLSRTESGLTPETGISIPGLVGKQRYVAGLASGADGSLYVANLGNDTVYRLTGEPKTVQTSAHVGRCPYALALSPDGRTLAVADWADGAVSLLAPDTLREQARVTVGSHPDALAWDRDGRLFVADAGANAVSVIAGTRVTETIRTSLDPKDPVGSTPDALAVSPNGQRLFIANADNNDVAVVDVSNRKESRVIGFLPTGWYPSALAVSADGRTLFIGTGKGLAFRPNARPGTHVKSPEALSGYDYIGKILSGHISVISLPDAAGLAADTRLVRADTPSPRAAQDPAAIRRTVFPKITHIVYIIRENRTYDQVLGDVAAGNGDPRLTLFGENVTPNAHALARGFVLLDNLYCNGEVSEDGHQWCDGAYVTDYMERAWPLNYSGRGEPADDDGLKQSPAGYLWDDCARHGITYRTYGEAAHYKVTPGSPPALTNLGTLVGHSSEAYGIIPWFSGSRDLGRARVFTDDLRAAEKTGDWPRFIIMSLPEDHTQGLQAGNFTPTAHVGENDEALGQIVEAISHSRFWPQTAIFVVEDDAQNGPDHVDAHRTVALALSPYIRRGVVDSTLYTQASLIHTMELILGLPPMTQYDADATPLYNSFTSKPDLTPYETLPPRVDLNALNPATGPGAAASALLDLSAPDRADPDALNTILWHALKPGIPMPAPVRSALIMR